jgi:hypothetical protein
MAWFRLKIALGIDILNLQSGQNSSARYREKDVLSLDGGERQGTFAVFLNNNISNCI